MGNDAIKSSQSSNKDLAYLLWALPVVLTPAGIALGDAMALRVKINFFNLAACALTLMCVTLVWRLIQTAVKWPTHHEKPVLWKEIIVSVAVVLVMLIATLLTTALGASILSIESIFLGLSAGAQLLALYQVERLRTEKETHAKKIYHIALLAAAVFSAMAASMVIPLWGATILLLAIGARINAYAQNKKTSDENLQKLTHQTLLMQLLWLFAAILGLIIK